MSHEHEPVINISPAATLVIDEFRTRPLGDTDSARGGRGETIILQRSGRIVYNGPGRVVVVFQSDARVARRDEQREEHEANKPSKRR